MLKKFLIGTIVALALLVATNASAALDFGPTTLKVGSTGVYVSTLQSFVGAIADGSFGPMTKAKVMAWQAANGLTADGVFGPMSKAKANAGGAVTGTYPAGCTSNAGFSTTTGKSCAATSTTLPAGCTSEAGYSSTTGVKCDNDTGTVVTGPLAGGAGDLTMSETTTGVKDEVKEGTTVNVLGLKAEAEDSDIAITSMKVVLHNDSYAVSSEKLANYVDEVSIYMGTTKVGSADVADFSRESGSPDTFTKSIALTNAIIREGKEAKFYVALSAGDNLDSDDLDADWDVTAESLRFQDATGVIMSLGAEDDELGSNIVTFTDSSDDDSIVAKSSSTNPDDTTVLVDESDTTDDVFALAFKLDVDEDSSDVTVTSIPVTVTIDDSGAIATSVDSIEDVVDSVMVKIGGTEYEADLQDGETVTDGAGHGIYIADLDEGVTINSGDIEDVKVYVTVKGTEDNYDSGTVLDASVDVSEIDAETTDDEIGVEGLSTASGPDLTLSLEAATVTVSSKSSSTNDDNSVGTFSFTFKVTNDGEEDVVFTDANTTGNVEWTLLGTDTGIGAGELTLLSGDATEDGGEYTIASGDYATFSLDVTVTPLNSGDNGVYRARLEAVAGTDLGDDQVAGPETLSY